jgi:adhesin transport system outer membrane protein
MTPSGSVHQAGTELETVSLPSFPIGAFFAAALLLVPTLTKADSLRDAVRAAVTTNPSVHAASDEARASAYDLLKLQSEFQPELTLYGQAGARRLDDPASLAPGDNDERKFAREIGLNAQLVIFDGARRTNLVYANAARVDGNIFRLLDASETMALNATEVYIDVYRHLLLLDAARRNLARHVEIGKTVGDLVDGGKLPLSDRLQVDDRIRASQLVIVDIERRLRDADARYERIVGYKRRGGLSVPVAKVDVASLSQLLDTAVANSYRVRIAGIEIDRAAYERAVGEADRKPRITLDAGVRQGEDLDGVSGTETDTFIGLRMNWVLHKGGRSAESRALIERRNKAISERHVAIREVRELAERTWNAHQANLDRARLLDVQMAVNRRLVEQFETEFQAGARTLLELLEVERATFEVEFEKISADASLAFSRYRLLATQSRLARYFGVENANVALIPDFEERARDSMTSVFRTSIPELDRTDDR